MHAAPIEGEFFSTEHLESLADALVRESIQNSLDAALDGQPITVRFRMHELGGLSLSDDRYFMGLMPHLEAERNGLDSVPTLHEKMSVLIIEDFGTKGLEGDPEQDRDKPIGEDGTKNDFYYFWRNVGLSEKSMGDRGRWGLGKTVFQASSRINTFFGATVRYSDKAPLVMGHSVLRPHIIDGQLYYPYGWHGDWDEDFPSPITDPEKISAFLRDFHLDGRAQSPGLSIVIPFPDETISIEKLINSAIMHYFYPMAAGDLVVIAEDDTGKVEVNGELEDARLMKRNFKSRKFKKENLKNFIGLVRWAVDLPEDSFVRLKLHDTKSAPAWSEGLFEVGALEKLREQFEQGERIALRVPMMIQKDGEQPEQTFFRVFLQRDESLDIAEDHFIRDGITLVGVSTLKQRGVRVIVSIEDMTLSMLLGDSENPAHTEWQERSPKFKGKYVRGVSCLRFVKNSPREIVKIFSRPTTGRDPSLLSNIFSHYDPLQSKPDRKSGSGDGMGGDWPESPDILFPEKNIKIQKIAGGFRVSPIDALADAPKQILITVAYEVRQGNPFSKYNKFDFELDKPPINTWNKNVQFVPHKPNSLIALINKEDFMFRITGFDANRDLRVRVETWDKENAKEV